MWRLGQTLFTLLFFGLNSRHFSFVLDTENDLGKSIKFRFGFKRQPLPEIVSGDKSDQRFQIFCFVAIGQVVFYGVDS